MSHRGGIGGYQGPLPWSDTSAESRWSKKPLGSACLGPPSFSGTEAAKPRRNEVSLQMGSCDFQGGGWECAGASQSLAGSSPPAGPALPDAVKEPVLAGAVGNTASPVPAELCSGGAGFRERTCKR